MHVLTISNQKGGVGKTTTSVALGGIAMEAGRRVLLVDLDPHGSLTAYFKLDPDTISQGVYSLFAERRALTVTLIRNAISPSTYDGISLLPASTALATIERQGIGDGMGLVLGKVLSLLNDEFDLVIVDCPPQLGVLMVNALAACDQLIIPVQTEFLALKGLDRMLHTLKMLSRSRQRDLSYLIVPTMYDRRTHASVSSLKTLRDEYSQNVWSGKIPIDTKLRDASKAGVPPNVYAANSRSVSAYHALYDYLMAAVKLQPETRPANEGAQR